MLPARIRWEGQTYTRSQVQQRVDEVAAYLRNHDRPILMKDGLTRAALHYLRDGVLPLDNYTTR